MIEILLIVLLALSTAIFQRQFQLGWGVSLITVIAANFVILALLRLLGYSWVSPSILTLVSISVLAVELMMINFLRRRHATPFWGLRKPIDPKK